MWSIYVSLSGGEMMKYAYNKSSYQIRSLNLELFIWNKEKNFIFSKISEYTPLFNYHDFKDLKEIKHLYEIDNPELKKCIFCLKDSNQTKFKKFPHVIPYLLGNTYLLHHEECDECNTIFGKTIECELDKYMTPLRTLNRVTNRSGNLIHTQLGRNRDFKFDLERKIYTGELGKDQTNLENSNPSFNLRQHKYRPMLVYKAFLKIFFGLLPREHLSKFENIRKWIINPDNNFQLFTPMNVKKTKLDFFSTSILDVIIFHKDVTNLDEFKQNLPIKEDFEYLAILRFGHVVFQFPIFTDLCFQKLKFMKENNLPLEFNLPNIPYFSFTTDSEDIDFSETNIISTNETIYFQYD